MKPPGNYERIPPRDRHYILFGSLRRYRGRIGWFAAETLVCVSVFFLVGGLSLLFTYRNCGLSEEDIKILFYVLSLCLCFGWGLLSYIYGTTKLRIEYEDESGLFDVPSFVGVYLPPSIDREWLSAQLLPSVNGAWIPAEMRPGYEPFQIVHPRLEPTIYEESQPLTPKKKRNRRKKIHDQSAESSFAESAEGSSFAISIPEESSFAASTPVRSSFATSTPEGSSFATSAPEGSSFATGTPEGSGVATNTPGDSNGDSKGSACSHSVEDNVRDLPHLYENVNASFEEFENSLASWERVKKLKHLPKWKREKIDLAIKKFQQMNFQRKKPVVVTEQAENLNAATPEHTAENSEATPKRTANNSKATPEPTAKNSKGTPEHAKNSKATSEHAAKTSKATPEQTTKNSKATPEQTTKKYKTYSERSIEDFIASNRKLEAAYYDLDLDEDSEQDEGSGIASNEPKERIKLPAFVWKKKKHKKKKKR